MKQLIVNKTVLLYSCVMLGFYLLGLASENFINNFYIPSSISRVRPSSMPTTCKCKKCTCGKCKC